MTNDSIVERILFGVSRRLSLFFGERTHQWAENEIEDRIGTDVRLVGIDELESEYDISNGAMYLNPSDDSIRVLKGDRTERGIRALSIALQYRIPAYTTLAIFTTVTVLAIGCVRGFNWNALGISYDVLGAAIVARGVFRTPVEIDNSASATQLSGPIGNAVEKLVSAVETVDGMIGTVLLSFGFIIQFATKEGLISGIVLITVIGVIWWYNR